MMARHGPRGIRSNEWIQLDKLLRRMRRHLSGCILVSGAGNRLRAVSILMSPNRFRLWLGLVIVTAILALILIVNMP